MKFTFFKRQRVLSNVSANLDLQAMDSVVKEVS